MAVYWAGIVLCVGWWLARAAGHLSAGHLSAGRARRAGDGEGASRMAAALGGFGAAGEAAALVAGSGRPEIHAAVAVTAAALVAFAPRDFPLLRR